ncbi:hypothetical protein FACS1894184_08430 [Clostridia bacterium]|nr:hypothetical protein FACS1894184_08430 [Clostridia bacterium]
MDNDKPATIRLTREQEDFVLHLRRTHIEMGKWSLTKIAHEVFDLGVKAAKREGKIA